MEIDAGMLTSVSKTCVWQTVPNPNGPGGLQQDVLREESSMILDA